MYNNLRSLAFLAEIRLNSAGGSISTKKYQRGAQALPDPRHVRPSLAGIWFHGLLHD